MFARMVGYVEQAIIKDQSTKLSSAIEKTVKLLEEEEVLNASSSLSSNTNMDQSGSLGTGA